MENHDTKEVGLKLIDFKICFYSNEKIKTIMNPFVVISGNGLVLKAKEWVEKNLKDNFEVLQMIVPSFLNDIGLKTLQNLCLQENISLKEGELKPDSTVRFVGSKESLKLLQKELDSLKSNSIIYPWKNVSTQDFNLLKLNETETDPEFIFVHHL